MSNYRTGFLLALIGNIVLIGILVGFLWHSKSATSEVPKQEGLASQAISNSSTLAASEASLVPVQLSPQKLQSIGVTISEVRQQIVADEVRATGNVVMDETRLAYVQTRFSGYIQKVLVDATYQYVRKGQPLFTIYSPDLVATEREYLVAKQNQQQVAQSTVSGVAASAALLLDATAGRLKQWGVSQEELSRLESSGQVEPEVEVYSPVSGFVTERNALPSVAVQPEMRLYTIADLSTVWVQAQVFQNDLGRVKVGDVATLTVDTFPGRVFSGRVNLIYPQLDTDTRTAKVRIVFPNRGLQLKPGMFVNVALKLPMGRQLVIPASAVLQSGTRQIAFVDRGDGYLEPREVQLGARAGDEFVVLKGIKEGEKIVTSANFLIDSESQLQAALGSFVPPPPGAGEASVMNAPQVNVEMTSDPNPPRKGSNAFRVKVADTNGAPITDAEVSVAFFMAAMPEMGMAAMRTQVNLSEKNGGIYEGSGELGSGGTWQVTILVRRNGQTIANKQISVSATGGM